MKNKWLFLSLFISLLAGWALLTGRHFHTHDDIQVFRLNEYIECWKDTQFPCRWSSDLGKGYGYPYFIFYPPAIYIIPSLIHLLTRQSLIFSLNLSAYLTFPLAAYAMYRLVYLLTKRGWLGFIGSALYTFAPYHALNIFVRGVYAENLAWALFPLLLVWGYQLIKNGQNWLQLTLGLSVLFLTHNISALLMLPLLATWILFLAILYKKPVKNLLLALTSALCAIGLSAWFLIPAFVEKGLVQTESMVSDYYHYLNHFVSLNQVFLSNFWGYGASGYETAYDGMSFALGTPISLGILLLIFFLFTGKVKKTLSFIFFFLVILGVSAIFLTHAKSLFIWETLPLLAYIQFPWRFLGVATTLLVAAVGYGLSLVSPRVAKIMGASLLIASIVLYAPRFRPEKLDATTDADYLVGSLRQNQQVEHVYDYLPKTVARLPDDFASNVLFTIPAGVEILSSSHSSQSLKLSVRSEQAQALILSQFYYPGWQARVDGQVVALEPDPLHGLSQIQVPAGSHEVSLQFSETPLRLFANILSLFTLVTFLYLVSRLRSQKT